MTIQMNIDWLGVDHVPVIHFQVVERLNGIVYLIDVCAIPVRLPLQATISRIPFYDGHIGEFVVLCHCQAVQVASALVVFDLTCG